MPYFDVKTGLLCDKAEYYDSENAILWLAEYLILLNKKDETKTTFCKTMAELAMSYLANSGQLRPNPDPTKFLDEGFSRDNIIAVTSLGLLYSQQNSYYGIKYFDFPRYMQPQDFCYLLYCYHWLFKPLITITWLCMFWAFWSLKETDDGGLHTDGRLLSFVRCEALSSKGYLHQLLYNWGQKISAYRVKKFFTKYPDRLPKDMTINMPTWRIVFALYFQDRQHPINKLAEELWV